MFDTVCTFPLTAELFAQAVHPTEPLLTVGLSDGHVETLRLPPVLEDDGDATETASANGTGQIETVWRTRRHKGSCRSLAYSFDGGQLFSAGTDGIVKVADSLTGKVVDKIAIPLDPSTGLEDEPSLLHILNPQTLLFATDSSALHLYDLRVDQENISNGFKSRKPQQTHHPHTDYISSLTPLAPTEASTSGFSKQWISTGGTTLAVTDVRRGVLMKSEDQEEELLSSVFVSGLSKRGGGTSVGEKVVVGGAGGVITLWERGQWDDQDERIVVDRGYGTGPSAGGESLDVLTLLPDGVGTRKTVAAGMGNGQIRFVQIGSNKVVDQVRHDDVEGVIGIGFDVGGRMISGGGDVIKVWHEKVDEDNGGYVEDGNRKRPALDDSSDDDQEEEEDEPEEVDSEEDEVDRKQKKKRKGNKGNHLNGKGSFSFSGLD